MSEKKVMLTQEGYDKLVEKLEHLKTVTRNEVAERLKTARALGDLSENAEYDEAQNAKAFLEGEIKELETKIRNSVIISEETDSGIVSVGSTVVIRDLEFNEDETYMIVGSTEADPDSAKISNESPVGAALLGKTVGSIVQVHAPTGILQYKILEIK